MLTPTFEVLSSCLFAVAAGEMPDTSMSLGMFPCSERFLNMFNICSRGPPNGYLDLYASEMEALA